VLLACCWCIRCRKACCQVTATYVIAVGGWVLGGRNGTAASFIKAPPLELSPSSSSDDSPPPLAAPSPSPPLSSRLLNQDSDPQTVSDIPSTIPTVPLSNHSAIHSPTASREHRRQPVPVLDFIPAANPSPSAGQPLSPDTLNLYSLHQFSSVSSPSHTLTQQPTMMSHVQFQAAQNPLGDLTLQQHLQQPPFFNHSQPLFQQHSIPSTGHEQRIF
jgi:hypothetical protein